MSSNIFFKKLKRIYNGKTYFEKYGGDLWLCFILITLFTSISTYFHVSGQINTLKTSWVDNKCNPRYMPFANIMNKDKNVSAMEYTEQNFISCIGDMFKQIMKILMEPLVLALQMIAQAMEALVALFNELCVAIAAAIKFILALLAKLMQILANLVNVAKNFFHDIGQINAQVLGITGVISAIGRAVFTAFGSLLNFIFATLIKIVTDIIIIVLAMLAAALARLLYGILKVTQGGAEEGEAAAEEGFWLTIALGIATMIKGIWNLATGTVKIIMGIIGIIAAIVILIICLYFLDLLFAIHDGIIHPIIQIALV